MMAAASLITAPLAGAALILSVATGPSVAPNGSSELSVTQKNAATQKFVRTATDCIARTVAADPTHRDHGGTVYHRSSRQHLDRSPTETGGANHRVIAAVP